MLDWDLAVTPASDLISQRQTASAYCLTDLITAHSTCSCYNSSHQGLLLAIATPLAYTALVLRSKTL